MQATTSTIPDPRDLTNRANAQHSTGPRTPDGKARSAQNDLTHGLTSRTAVLPSEDLAAIDFDIVDAHRLLATLGLHGHRLSRQFQKTVQLLWDLQADRKQTERRDLTRAAGILELHKHKGIPYDPAIDGFVFSKDEIEAYGQRLGASKRHPPASS